MRADLSTRYLGLELANPVVVSSTPATGRRESLLEVAASGAGAVVLPSLFEEEFLSGDAHLDGTGDHVALLRWAKQELDIPVIGSLNATKPGSWQRIANELVDAGADALELNLYTFTANPLTTSAEIELEHLAAIEAVRIVTDIPLAIKLSPYYSAISHFANQAVDAGADGLVLFNRFYAPDINLDTLEVFADADYSTASAQRLALRWIGILRGQLPGTSFAATSGVHSGTEVIKSALVGADVSYVASAVMTRGPQAIGQILAETDAWLVDNDYPTLAEIRGKVSAAAVKDASAYERAQYISVLKSAW